MSNASFNDEDIWQRLCQIVVNNESLHQLTCNHLLDYLLQRNISEGLAKTAAFLLGEYADLVASKVSCGDLFNLFTEKYFNVSNLCRAMILTSMMKLYKRDAGIGSALIRFYQLELNSLDVQLQTRSYEYLKIIQLEKIHGVQLTNVLFPPMVPFNSKKNPLLGRLSSADLSNSDTNTISTAELSLSTVPTPPPARNSKSSTIRSHYDEQNLSANWTEGFRRMLKHKQGVFYSSPFLKILYRLNQVPSHSENLELTLTYMNTSSWPLTSLLTEVVPWKTEENPPYVIKVIHAPSSGIGIGERTSHKLEILIRQDYPISHSPILSLSFKAGGHVTGLTLKLAAGVTNTIPSAQRDNRPNVSLPQFIQRWRALGDALGKDGEWHISVPLAGQEVYGYVRNCIEKLGFQIVEQSMVEGTIFAAGIVRTKVNGNLGCLMKLASLLRRRR